MTESNIRIQLDTVRKNNVRLIYAVQNDYGARYLTVEMMTDGKEESVSPLAVVSINAKRSDGRKNAFFGVVNADGTVTVPVTDWMLDVEGEVICSVAVVESGKRLTTTHFYMQAQESIWDGTSEPSADDPNRDVILEIIASEKERAETFMEMEKSFRNWDDAISPAASVKQTSSGAYIRMKDKNGETEANVYNGKSAYQYAQAGGYTGTETEYEEDINPDHIKKGAEDFITTELAKRGQLKPEFANSVTECTDTTKLYVLPDGMIWAYMLTETEVEGGAAYTNLLPLATDADRTTIYGEDYNGDGVNDGYITGKRLSSSGTLSNENASCVSGLIFPVTEGSVIRIKGTTPIQSSASAYMITYDGENTKIGHAEMPKVSDKSDWSSTTTKSYYRYDAENNEITITLDSTFGTGYNAIRFSAGTIDDNTIVTVNEEIKNSEHTTITDYAWASTGHAFVPADYEDRIIDLENETAQNTADIEKLKSGVADIDDSIAYIREWDAPIYDRTPVWEITSEKAGITSAEKTVASVYAKYDALMAEHPDFITRTDLGLCSDGVTHVYRYDFCEREPRHQSGFEWSETKPKFIVVTGIHREWNGIYGMIHALSEIATNSELAELRRSVHFIVVPVLNPYSISGPYATVGHAANANGVEIHRNFEVGFKVAGEGTIHYSGVTPLSEVESQYLDNILKNNADAAYFLTCHSFDRDKTWGVGFLWGSSATKYMCNMAFRVIDKMGKAWHKKYGTTWETGIANANNGYTALDVGDYRIGHAALTNTGGCEQRQATKYGIQATNFEVGETFFVLDGTSLSAKAITHGAEAYVNFFLTAMGCYDRKDRKDYAPGLPMTE